MVLAAKARTETEAARVVAARARAEAARLAEVMAAVTASDGSNGEG